jgi:hypothetical protein
LTHTPRPPRRSLDTAGGELPSRKIIASPAREIRRLPCTPGRRRPPIADAIELDARQLAVFLAA